MPRKPSDDLKKQRRAAYMREWVASRDADWRERDRARHRSYYEARAAETINKGRARRFQRVSEGKCYSCQNAALPQTVHCAQCWFKARAYAAGLSRNRWRDLEAIAQRQNWRCYYTGRPLAVGEGMSLDHVVPKTAPHYPGHEDLGNLVWCDKRVNVAKNNMAVEEFSAMIRDCFHHFVNV